jgi:hypothetical protein
LLLRNDRPRLQQLPDGLDERVAMGPQFHNPLGHNFFKQLLAPRLQRHQYLPPVFPATSAFNEAVCFHAVNQLYGAVMSQREPIRKRTDAGFLPWLKPANRQQQKVLLRLKARKACSCVALLQETPYQVTKL